LRKLLWFHGDSLMWLCDRDVRSPDSTFEIGSDRES
jgi:hypothetical protein